MKNTFEHKGIYFYEGTPIEVCDTLIKAKESKTRVVLDYGDIKTKQSWGDVYDITGYIGRSTGTKPMLLLIHNSRSTGGGSILTDCILSIKESKGKRVLYTL